MFEVLDQHYSTMCEASAAMLEEIALVDEKRLWREDGATSMTSWLAGRYELWWGLAREWVRVALALRRLPAVKEAFADGRLSFDQLKALTRFVTAEEDEIWARNAPGISLSKLWAEARRREKRTQEQADDDAKLRYMSMEWDEEQRFLQVEARLPGEQGAAFEQAVRRRAEEVVVEDGVLDPEGARLCDATVELVSESGDGRGAPVLVVHADVGVLSGTANRTSPHLAETESGVRLANETVRRLGCDAKIECVLTAGGVPVGVGRRSRTVPAWMGRLLRHRDRGCRFPGCERKRWLKAHHILHWSRGGPTDLDNLVLLCDAHHRLIHEGGWTVRGDPARRLRFHDPGGRVRPSRRPAGGQETRAAA